MGIATRFRRLAPVNYEGAWDHYARMWSRRNPGLAHIGDEWTGTASGGASPGAEYTRFIEDRFVTPYIDASDTVLEMGVGGGRTAVILRAHARELVCADISGKMLAATRRRLGQDGVRYVKIDGTSLDGVPDHSVDVFFSFDTMVHIEPRDIYNYLTRVPRLMRGKRLCILNHMNVLTDRGWARFLTELDRNLMGRRGTAFSVMTDGIMQRFLDHLGYEVVEKDTTSIPRDCVWVVRAPEDHQTAGA